MCRGLILAVMTLISASAFAEVRVSARLDRTRIYIGEQVKLTVDVNGARQVDPPELSIPGVAATYLGGGDNSSTSVTIINGQMQRVERHCFVMQYALRPARAGTITIPPIQIEHEGTTYKSNALLLQVVKPEAQEYVILEQEADPAQVYAEQGVKVRLKVYLRKMKQGDGFSDIEPIFPRSMPHLEIPWFEGFNGWQTADVNDFAKPLLGDSRSLGFAVNNYTQTHFFDAVPICFKLPRASVERTCKDGRRRPYFCYTLEKLFRPVSPGTFEVPAVRFKGTIPIELDSLGRRAVDQKAIVVASPSLSVKVKAVPTEGRPEDFSGAIGHYSFEADATPKAAKVGDPIDLILSVTGDGILENIPAPDLSKQPELLEHFRVHTDAPVVNITGSTKTFRYTIRARDDEVDEIPRISFSYFDVGEEQFKTAYSKPVSVSISPTATMSLTEVVETGGRAHSRLGRELEEGLLANFTGDDVLTSQEFGWDLSVGLALVLVLPPVACLAALVGQRQVSRLRTDVALARSRGAKKEALGRLKKLSRHSATLEAAEFCGQLSKTLTCYVADKLNLPREGVTTDDVSRRLPLGEGGDSLREAVTELVSRCDSGRFGASEIAHDRAEMINSARDVIRRIEKKMR